mmetsp:Transcript_14921/g.60855  ORF Transcript_14921/g.60855 Transcript_14921/m.60855 type:complete len:200 (-) Transcript_14921:3282-3881(-)
MRRSINSSRHDALVQSSDECVSIVVISGGNARGSCKLNRQCPKILVFVMKPRYYVLHCRAASCHHQMGQCGRRHKRLIKGNFDEVPCQTLPICSQWTIYKPKQFPRRRRLQRNLLGHSCLRLLEDHSDQYSPSLAMPGPLNQPKNLHVGRGCSSCGDMRFIRSAGREAVQNEIINNLRGLSFSLKPDFVDNPRNSNRTR